VCDIDIVEPRNVMSLELCVNSYTIKPYELFASYDIQNISPVT